MRADLEDRLSILAAAAEVPDRIAIVDSGVARTYAEIAERTRGAIDVLARLDQHEASAGRRLECAGLVATDTLETLVLAYALIELRVPIVLIHPRATEREQARMLAEHDALRVGLGARGDATGSRAAGATALATLRDPTDAAPLAIIYTSGTSGRSKGAVLSRRAFLDSAAQTEARLGWADGDRWLLALPPAHIGGFSILTRTLAARRTLVLTNELPSDLAARIITSIARDRVTIASIVPTLLYRLLRCVPAWDPPSYLRALIVGGAPASSALLEESAARGWPVLTTYGLTEACSMVTLQRPGTRPGADRGAGEPLDRTEIRIGPGGQVELRGPILFSGYAPRSAHPSPFLPGGWFSTGDLGEFDHAGQLHLRGRSADLIITGGENVYPREVEEALESDPAIREAAVFGQPDAEWGEIVCAAIVPAAGSPDAEAAAARATLDLAAFKRPRRVLVVEALPRNALGKLDRARLRALDSTLDSVRDAGSPRRFFDRRPL